MISILPGRPSEWNSKASRSENWLVGSMSSGMVTTRTVAGRRGNPLSRWQGRGGGLYAAAMKHEANLSASTRRLPDVADFARAKAAQAAGGDIEHVVVGQWLLTWGKPGRKSFAEWLHEQDG